MGNITGPGFDMYDILVNARKRTDSLKFDRILDSENEVYIGIGKYATQVIRIGNHYNKTHKLLNFKKDESKLKYEFEDDVTLILKKKDDTVHMNLVDMYSNKTVSKPIDPFIIKNFKTIHLKPSSNEFDEIGEFFKVGE
jgi:hypothetical protein